MKNTRAFSEDSPALNQLGFSTSQQGSRHVSRSWGDPMTWDLKITWPFLMFHYMSLPEYTRITKKMPQPSGNLLHSYWKWHRKIYSWFTYEKWQFFQFPAFNIYPNPRYTPKRQPVPRNCSASWGFWPGQKLRFIRYLRLVALTKPPFIAKQNKYHLVI